MKTKSKIVDLFYTNFNDLKLKYYTSDKKDYDIKATKPTQRNLPFDISIKIGRKTVAIIEFKAQLYFKTIDFTSIENYTSKNNIRYYIISDGIDFIIYDRRNLNIKEKINFNKLVEIIQRKEEVDLPKLRVAIARKIKEIIINSNFKFLKERIDSLMNKLLNSIDFSELDYTFFFKGHNDINNIENLIFRLLLKEDKPLEKIFRYTTLNTIFSMLSNNSYRMNCLVGMNDTTEVNYAENYITGETLDYTLAHWQTIDSYNRRFISSCSLKEDDLTQWRLYADDSKGVCLTFNINAELLNTKFILKRISYGHEDNSHPELDLIKQIITSLREEFDIDFEFRTLSTWRHFFKPSDYSIEKEVRLLYILNDADVKKGWVLTNSHNILNPFVEFKLNDMEMPIDLTSIILGPKSPEKEINRKQFEQYIRELRRKRTTIEENGNQIEVDVYNIPRLTVSISKIKNYR